MKRDRERNEGEKKGKKRKVNEEPKKSKKKKRFFNNKGEYKGNLHALFNEALQIYDTPLFRSAVDFAESFEDSITKFGPRGKCAQPCMNFQYAVEILAKAVLQKHCGQYPKTHSIQQLCEELAEPTYPEFLLNVAQIQAAQLLQTCSEDVRYYTVLSCGDFQKACNSMRPKIILLLKWLKKHAE
eukprot:TRINITY_DN66334_c5_g3_i3.p2 TRINITY_DN66334_c5_g3~~TRINITY_DN66334_c5_g3_i3.p2  ORF type:complete len:184 (+),score=18.32 TRINITY_DN66334_c5_g3_i3:21-572(+)